MEIREFISQLETNKSLTHIRKPVSVKYEISSIVKMLQGKPVIFENIKESSISVVSNLCATRDLVCLGLGIKKQDLLSRLAYSIDHPVPIQVSSNSDYNELSADLTQLPILTYYPKDGGPYIPSGIAFAKDPQYGINASYHRAMVLNKDHLALRIVERHLHFFRQRGLKEFAFCIGNSIPVLLCGAISAELGKCELEIANSLSPTKAIELAGHIVPESEIVIICEFTGEDVNEGPFLDLTETFDIIRQQPVVKIKHIFSKNNPLFHGLLPGDLEHKILMGMPREPTVFREVAKVCDCQDVYINPGGCSWLHGIVKIRKHNEDDGKKAIEAAFAGHHSMKHVFIVDEDIDIENPYNIEWALATRFQGNRGLIVKNKQKGSSLDPSSDMATKETTKVGFDLTRPLKTTGKDFSRPELPMKINLEDYL